MVIKVIRGTTTVQTVQPKVANRVSTLAGENYVDLTFDLNSHYDFELGDKITLGSSSYYLNDLPNITKHSDHHFEYRARFEALYYDLKKVQFMYAGVNDFYFNGSLRDIVNIIMDNVDRVYGSGHLDLDEVADTEHRNLYFSGMNCMDVLLDVVAEWELEFYFRNEELYVLKSIGDDTGYSFSYGKGHGLYSLERVKVDSSELITRLYPLGAERNLTWDYRTYSPDSRNLLKRAGATDLAGAVDDNGYCTKTRIGTNMYKFECSGGTSDIRLYVDESLLVDSDPYYCSVYYKDASANFYMSWAGTTASLCLSYATRGFESGTEVYTTSNCYLSIQISDGEEVTLYDAQIEATGYTAYEGGYALTSGRFNKRLLIDTPPNHYLESNVATYGLIEYTKKFDDVYPRRTGVISTVGSELEFCDSTMDFDLNDQLISGVPALVHFNTGDLAGYEFQVEIYEHTGNSLGNRYFKLLTNQNQQGFILPDVSGLKPAVYDEYVLLDIEMPSSYITAAETELEAAGQAYLDDHDTPRVAYNLEIDPVYAEAESMSVIAMGDSVTIVDSDLSINALIRVVGITYDLTRDYKMSLTLGEDNMVIPLLKRIKRNENRWSILRDRTKGDQAPDARKGAASVDDPAPSPVYYNTCPDNSTTVFPLGTTYDVSYQIAFTAKRNMGTLQSHTGRVTIHYDATLDDAVAGPTMFVGPDLDYYISASVSLGMIRMEVVVGSANTNDLEFGYKIDSKFYT